MTEYEDRVVFKDKVALEQHFQTCLSDVSSARVRAATPDTTTTYLVEKSSSHSPDLETMTGNLPAYVEPSL